jgi:hypothetical protein
MKETDLAYYAGIFDGEGCVSIVKKAWTSKITTRHREYYNMECSIGNLSEWLIYSLKMSFGGVVLREDYRGDRPFIWRWKIQGRRAADFLRVILPYTHLKKPQIDVALLFQDYKKEKCARKSTEAELAIQETQRILVQNLKRI